MSWLKKLLPVIIIFILPTIFFLPLFFTFGIGPREDELMQYFPCMYWLANHLQAGTIPLWNHLIYGGYSAISDPQTGICYPLNWFACIVGVRFAYPFLLLGHYWLAGLGMYLLGRSWRLTKLVSFAGAVVWMFSGFMLGHRTHYTILAAISYLPIIIYFWNRYSESAKGVTKRRWFIAIVIAQSLQILAGHIQTAGLSAVIVFFYLLIADDGRKAIRRIADYLVSYVFVFGLTAFSILPAIDMFDESVRSFNSYRFVTENSFFPAAWPVIFAPASMGLRVPNFLYHFRYFGPWHLCELNCFVTLTGLILACFAIKMRKQFDRQQYRLTMFFAMMAGVAIFLSLGRYNPVYKIFYYIPFWNAFRCPARYLVWLDFSAACLAMFALEYLRDNRDKIFQRFATKFVVVISILFVVYLYIVHYIFTHYSFADILPRQLRSLPALAKVGISTANMGIIIPLIFACVIISGVNLFRSKRLAYVLVVLIILECAAFAPFYDFHFEQIGKINFYPPAAAKLDKLSQTKGGFLLPLANDPYRKPLAELQPFCNLFVNRPTITGYGPMLNKYHRRIFSFELWPTTQRWLDIITRPKMLNRYGIKYLIVEKRIDEQIQSLVKIAKSLPHDSKKYKYKPVLSLDTNNIFFIDAPADGGLYQMTFYAKRTSADQLRLNISLAGVKNKIWNDQSFTLNIWDVGTDWRKFILTFYLPAGENKARIFFIPKYGSLMLKDIKIIPRQLDLSYLKRYECSDRGVIIYENTECSGLPYFAKTIEPVNFRCCAADRVLFDIDSTKTYLVADGENPFAKLGGGEILSYKRAVNKLIIKVRVSGSAGLLIIPAGYNSDWLVTIDGVKAKLLCADGISRAAFVPKGTHSVMFRYFPRSLKIGLLIMFIAMILLIVLYRLR